MYSLFKDGVQVSKAHSTEAAVWAEAHELGVVLTSSPDFVGDAPSAGRGSKFLAPNYEVRKI